MPLYVDLATLHTPSNGGNPPAAWGLQVRDNLETLARPPRVHAHRTASQLITNAATTAIVFQATAYDAGYDGPTPHWQAGDPTKVTIRRAGRYLVLPKGRWQAGAGGSRQMYPLINGTGVGTVLEATAGATGLVGGSATDIMVLASGDYLQMWVYQNAGTAINMTDAAMIVTWMGPT